MTSLRGWQRIVPTSDARRSAAFVACACIIAFVVRLATTNFGHVLRKDAVLYLIKSAEIARGNLAPLFDRSFGLSWLFAPWAAVAGDRPVVDLMSLAKIFSVMVASLIIVPIYLLGRQLLERRGVTILVVLAVFSSGLVKASSLFLTEAPFMMLLLMSLWCVMRASIDARSVALAAVFAGMAYIMRPNGILWLPLMVMVLAARMWPDRKLLFRFAAICCAAFALTCAPFLLQRYLHFGSAFRYSLTAPLADAYSNVWKALVTWAVGLASSVFDLIHARGVFQYSAVSSPLLLPWSVVGVYQTLRSRTWLPIHIAAGGFLLAMSATYTVLGNTPRHLAPMEPLLLLYAAASLQGLELLARKATAAVLLAVYVAFSMATPAGHAAFGETPIPAWTTWVAQNLQGRLSAMCTEDLIAIQLHEATISGLSKGVRYQSPKLTLIEHSGFGPDLASAKAFYRAQELDYVIVCADLLDRDPFLKPAYEGLDSSFETVKAFEEVRVLRLRQHESANGADAERGT